MNFDKGTLQLRLAASAFALTAAFGAPAFAQDSEGETDTIVVTGFRQSLAAALSVKRNENGVVDAIVAEDIADFPDLNLAESLQRIPGVAIDRQAGEGRRVTVRGLGGNFTRVRINGMETLSVSGGSDASGGTNRSRTFDFNTFASDLFNELVVRKTQSASVEEGSLGANVELKTAQPFDFKPGFSGAVSGQALYNDLIEETAPRFAGLASWSNDAKTVGFLVSVAYTDRNIREEGFSTVRFDDAATFRSVNGTPCDGVTTGDCQAVRDAWYARIPRYGRLDYEQERLGVTASAQFQPTERTLISIDGLYSEFDGERDENFMEVFIRSNTDNIDITDFSINSSGVLDYFVGDIQPDASSGIVPVRTERRRDILTTDFNQFSAKIEHDFTDTVRASLFAGMSESEFEIPQQATIFFDAATTVSGYSLDFRQGLETPFIDFGDLDVTDPSEFLFTQYRNRPQGVDNTFETIRGDAEWDVSEEVTISGGFSYKRFEFATREARAEGSVTDLAGFSSFIPVTPALSSYVDGFGNGLDLPGGVDTRWLTPNFDAAADLIDLFSIPAVVRGQDTRSVEEESTGAYIQADFEFLLGAMPVRGDVGVRYVATDVASTGFLGADEVTILRDYDDTLPALNLVFEVSDDFLVRTGVAKVMSRPSLGNLTPGGSIDSFNGPPYTLNQGNPGLDPFRATNYDVSLEWYFAEEALLAFSYFYKDVESFSTSSDTIETTFFATGIPVAFISPTSPLGIDIANGLNPAVDLNTRVNGSSGAIQGFEIVYQQPFNFLPVEGFGFTGNFTHVESDEIIGFSPDSFNATFYYESGPFQARISGAYRDAYQTRMPNSSGRTAGREERGVASTFNLDFASAWAVTDALDITFEAVNLTDEFEHQTFDRLELPTLYHHTGRNFLIGARYRF